MELSLAGEIMSTRIRDIDIFDLTVNAVLKRLKRFEKYKMKVYSEIADLRAYLMHLRMNEIFTKITVRGNDKRQQ